MIDNTIYIAVCDDELDDLKEARTYLDELLKQYDKRRYNFIVHEYECGKQLISSSVNYHILLQDVDMPEINGFDVAYETEKREIKPKVIFLTNHIERADESHFVDTYRYLYKPINRDKFQEALSSAIRLIKEIEWIPVNYIDLSGTREKVIINVGGIVYTESLGGQRAGSVIYTSTEILITRNTLKHWLEVLPSDSFLQSSKTYIVNVKYALPIGSKKTQRNNLKLKTGQVIDASRGVIDTINKAIFQLIKESGRK